MRVLLALLAIVPLLVAADPTWSIVEARNPDIMMDVACNANATTCAIVGGYSNTAFGVYYTVDGFQSGAKLAQIQNGSLMIMSIASQKSGISATAGIGLGTSSAIMTSNDIKSWVPSNVDAFAVGQDIKVIRDGKNEFGFAFTGTVDSGSNEDGLFVARTNKPYTKVSWAAELRNVTSPRYGSFPSPTTWYVTGGHWPSRATSRRFEELGNCVRRSETYCQPMPTSMAKHVKLFNDRLYKNSNKRQDYMGVITKTTDSGKTWNVVYKNVGSFYFNDITCFTPTRCAAVAEGDSQSYIYLIDNDVVTLAFEDTDHPSYSSLFSIEAVSETEAWAAGGFRASDGSIQGAFYRTKDAGATWALEASVPNLGLVTGMTFTSPTNGFAVGTTNKQTSVVLTFK